MPNQKPIFQTLDQTYSLKAKVQIEALKEKYGLEACKPYGAMAHKLPILIYSAGLAQALEFVNARGSTIQKLLLTHLSEVLLSTTESTILLESIRTASVSRYLHLTRQSLAALLWYKRFAQSLLDVDATEASLIEEVNQHD